MSEDAVCQPLDALSSDSKKNGDEVVVYTAQAIATNEAVLLHRGGMILIALLSGGDYDEVCVPKILGVSEHLQSRRAKIGLPGCGVQIAHRLSRYGLGESILDAGTKLPFQQLSDFLVSWRAQLRHALFADPAGHLGRKCPALANNISATFPDPLTVIQYAAPIISWSDGQQHVDFSDVKPRPPDVTKLASLCERLFSWGTAVGILCKFNTTVWDGACMRMLCEVRARVSASYSQTP
jgi:Holliday junction resolvase YEN1